MNLLYFTKFVNLTKLSDNLSSNVVPVYASGGEPENKKSPVWAIFLVY